MSVLEDQIKPKENYWAKKYVIIEWDLYSILLYAYVDTQLMTFTGFYGNLVDCLKNTETVNIDAFKINLSKPHKVLIESDEPITNLNYPELFI